MLEQLTQMPILPMAYAADCYWQLKSWDRVISHSLPIPFKQISIEGTLLCP